MKKMTYGPDPSTFWKHWDAGKNWRALRQAIVLLLMLFLAIAARSQDNTPAKISVLTYHYDNLRTGQDTHETTLTHSNVNTNQFGRLFVRTTSIQGVIVGQPLYMPGLSIAGGTHNVVFVATNAAMVYAFDADSNSGANAKPLWQASLIDTVQEETSSFARGVTSTPVIDASTGIMYVEAKSRLKSSATFFHRLHALDILTGKEKSGSPVPITGTYAGVDFNSTIINQMNRPALLLANGIVYLGFASDCSDFGNCGGTTPVNYYGWVFAYNAANLQQEGIFNTTPTPGDDIKDGVNEAGGGIWMSGAGLAADNSTPTANVFFATGNGEFDPTATSPTNFGDSILKIGLTSTTSGAIAPDQDLKLLDWFTPWDEENLETADLDLGSGGVLLLPDQSSTPHHLLVQAGKGTFMDPKPCSPAGSCFAPIHVLDRDQLTKNDQHFCGSCKSTGTNTNIHQEIQKAVGGMWSMPAFWNNTVYFWGNNDTLKGYALSNSRLSTPPVVTSSDIYPRAANMAISANGATNGIVWAAETGSTPPMILNAYNAGNGQLLYSSMQNQGRDNAGGDVHFIVPMVANGKVYLGGTQLSVYGLNPPDFTMSIVPPSQVVTAGGAVAFHVFITTINNFNADVSLTVNICPPIASCTITGDPIAASTSTSGSAILTVATQSSLPQGFYPIEVTASGGDITHTQTAILDVR